ncbi:MAG: menaquinone reductase multiheme cytochrome c subunit QrcA [Desulfovibrionaceae bacterium]|jgi:hypothetical protein
MKEMQIARQSGGALAFLAGVLAALVIGWWIFPQVLFSKQEQPIRFSHQVHVVGQDMACDDCHFYREDGSFAGLPTNEKCGECHEDVMGEDPAEEKYVTEYYQEGKEVPWLIYQYQPDNVYFSHNAHQQYDCTECHPNLADNDSPPPYYRNRISGYSKDTMKMWRCERCHAQNHVSNACYVCHK